MAELEKLVLTEALARFEPGEIRKVTLTDDPRPVECDRCGARFPLEETHAESGGECACGGDLVLHVHANVLLRPNLERVNVTIKADD